ncbi:ras-related rab-43-like protein, partial [Mytilus galloprovincialis]
MHHTNKILEIKRLEQLSKRGQRKCVVGLSTGAHIIDVFGAEIYDSPRTILDCTKLGQKLVYDHAKSLYLEGKLLQIWDTAGQERFRTITQSYYRSANGVILAYDITRRESFEDLPRWLEDVKRYAGGSIVQCLIGNKRDLEHLREVNTSEAKNFAQQHNMIDVIETSAKENTNVEQVFLEMATELKRRIGGDSGLASSKSGGISLNTQT